MSDVDEEEYSYEPSPKDLELVCAAADGKLEECKRLLLEDADPCYQDLETGMSVLMAASGAGQNDIVTLLLEEGAPWNAVDRKYLCAGDYAAKKGHQQTVDLLLKHAVIAEMLLARAIDHEIETDKDTEPDNDVLAECIEAQKNPFTDVKPTALNASYLSSCLEYSEDGKRLTDTETKLAVMMDWEQPLMAMHAGFICHADEGESMSKKCRVLNVGFGMGIVDKEIQTFSPKCHVIIEAHPQVIERINATKFNQQPGVRVVEGRWQTAVRLLAKEIEEGSQEPFDGIFFDTYAEDDRDLRQFHSWLPKLLRSNSGRYSYYNGLCPDNVFFHGVACETMRLLLNRLGLTCEFTAVPIDVDDPRLWKDLTSRYWYFDTYYLPKCYFLNKS